MKIICISGSPRKSGNTSTVFNKLRENLKDFAEIEIVYLTDYKINGCLGCSACQDKIDSIYCSQKDDAITLLKKIVDADLVLYGTPLYGHSYSGQLKIFMDRHVSLFKFIENLDKSVNEMEIFSFLKNKPVGLVVCCQGPEEDNSELIKMQFNKFCESSLASSLGVYIFPFCHNIDANLNISSSTIHTLSSTILSQ